LATDQDAKYERSTERSIEYRKTNIFRDYGLIAIGRHIRFKFQNEKNTVSVATIYSEVGNPIKTVFISGDDTFLILNL
jgi:hypothetical protein